MNTSFPVFLASGFDWETLIPLLIFVLYGVSQMFGRKKEEEVPDVEIEAELREQMEAEQAELERIRRKIEERVNTPEATHPAPNPLVRPPVLREITAQEQADDLASAQTFATARASEQESLQKRLAVQRERLAEARRVNTEATRKAYSIAGSGAGKQRRGKVVSSGSLAQVRNEAVQMLSHPASLRKAVILREILGPPISERQAQNSLPF